MRSVPRGFPGHLRKEAWPEVVALRIWNEAGGQIITRRRVIDQLERWRAHPPGCGCGCWLAAKVTDTVVFRVIAGWQAEAAHTRELSHR